jgi:Ca2+-binding EF-hand superfamily protein
LIVININNSHVVLSRIRQKLLEAGTNTIATLPKIYRSVDTFDGKNKVGINEFFNGLTNYGINLRKEEANVKLSILFI